MLYLWNSCFGWCRATVSGFPEAFPSCEVMFIHSSSSTLVTSHQLPLCPHLPLFVVTLTFPNQYVLHSVFFYEHTKSFVQECLQHCPVFTHYTASHKQEFPACGWWNKWCLYVSSDVTVCIRRPFFFLCLSLTLLSPLSFSPTSSFLSSVPNSSSFVFFPFNKG